MKSNTSKDFKQTKLLARTRYLKINGTMCCIVPNNVYLCVIKVSIKLKTLKNYQS